MKSQSSSSRKMMQLSIGVLLLISLGTLVLGSYLGSQSSRTTTNDVAQAIDVPTAVETVYPTIEPTLTPIPLPTTGDARGTQDEQVQQASFGLWSYDVVRRNGKLVGGVRYDASSVDALKRYAAENIVLADQLSRQGGEDEVNITFRSYLSPDQFRNWAIGKGLKVFRVDLEIASSDGKGSSLELGYSGARGASASDPLPESQLTGALQGSTATQQPPVQQSVRGVYYVGGIVQAKQLHDIAHDPVVFLTDVTVSVVRHSLTNSQIAGADSASIDIGYGLPRTPFWVMEHNFGLANFALDNSK